MKRTATDALSRTTSHGYDKQGQLIRVDHPTVSGKGVLTVSYTYDELGQRLSHTSSVLGRDTTDYDSHLYGRLRGTPNSRATAAAGLPLLYFSLRASRLNSAEIAGPFPSNISVRGLSSLLGVRGIRGGPKIGE